MFKSLFKLISLFIIIVFILISPKSRHLMGTSLKYISQILLWTVNDKNQDKWIMDKPNWLTKEKLDKLY